LDSKKNLIVVLGPTSVGKSQTAIKIATAFNGEIINCDSMQVYKGFDIGTDKISLEDREKLPHHLLDVVDPSTQFTAADFVSLALEAIQSILKRTKLPLVVGGTGLYLKALLDGLFPEGRSNLKVRQRLEKEAAESGSISLWYKLEKVDPVYAQKIGKNDKLRIIRALEVFLATETPLSEHFQKTRSAVKDFHILRIGLKLERQELYRKIEDRVEKMFERGFVDEVQRLLNAGVAEDAPPFRALGYKHVLRHIKEEISFEDAVQFTKRDTRHYAKRQMTWFRKMEGIRWFSPHDFSEIAHYIKDNLS
jgi:tRNA dimethylallyltransferase